MDFTLVTDTQRSWTRSLIAACWMLVHFCCVKELKHIVILVSPGNPKHKNWDVFHMELSLWCNNCIAGSTLMARLQFSGCQNFISVHKIAINKMLLRSLAWTKQTASLHDTLCLVQNKLAFRLEQNTMEAFAHSSCFDDKLQSSQLGWSTRRWASFRWYRIFFCLFKPTNVLAPALRLACYCG